MVFTPEPDRPVGGYRLTSDPPNAPFDLTFRFIDESGVSSVFDEVPEGETTEILRTNFGGPHRIMMNGVICDGTFNVENRLRTLIVVSVPAASECAVEVVGQEPYE